MRGRSTGIYASLFEVCFRPIERFAVNDGQNATGTEVLLLLSKTASSSITTIPHRERSAQEAAKDRLPKPCASVAKGVWLG
jgi:hypothetical protein